MGCDDFYYTINDERVCEEAASKLVSSHSKLKRYPATIHNPSTLQSELKKPTNILTSGCSWQEDEDRNIKLIFNQYGVAGKCLKQNLCRTLCLKHGKNLGVLFYNENRILFFTSKNRSEIS